MSFGFNSFEEALFYYSEPTYYEQSKGITEIRREIIEFSNNVKGAEITKSDGTITLVIFYRSRDRWIYILPKKDDFKGFSKAITLYYNIDEANKAIKNELLTQ